MKNTGEETKVDLIARKLNVFAQVYDRRINRLLIEAYVAALADLTVRQLEIGFSEAIKRYKFFPTPAEVRDAMQVVIEKEPRRAISVPDCDICQGTGWIVKGKYASKCDCRLVGKA